LSLGTPMPPMFVLHIRGRARSENVNFQKLVDNTWT